MRHDCHLAGPSNEDQIAEVRARQNSYRVQSMVNLIGKARAHHNGWMILRSKDMLAQAMNERALAKDCICRAKAIRERLFGSYYA